MPRLLDQAANVVRVYLISRELSLIVAWHKLHTKLGESVYNSILSKASGQKYIGFDNIIFCWFLLMEGHHILYWVSDTVLDQIRFYNCPLTL